MEIPSRSTHILEFAKDILDRIELSDYDGQSLLLKATRLARYVESEEIRDWLKFEMRGYNSKEENSMIYMSKTGRWINKEEQKGYWIPFAQIESGIQTSEVRLKQLRLPDTSSDNALIVIRSISNQIVDCTNHINKLNGIKSRVMSILHDFATNVYYERTFDNLAESIFDEYKTKVDLLIAENSGDVLQQIPAVIARLSDNEKESISQALTTCRRIIESFANHVFPPSNEIYIIGENSLSLKADKTLNRLNAYIHQRTASESRRRKLRQNLQNVFERVSAGVHSDVDAHEARSLFFAVYLLLGEILTLAS